MRENMLTIESISKAEETWEVKLPDDYKNFLLINSGIVPTKNRFINNNRIFVIERFLGIFPDFESNALGMYDIDVVISQLDERLLVKRDVYGYELIPIACVFAGDFICLDFRNNKENPEVCIWNHEESEEYEPSTDYICESFSKFLSLLE